MTEMKFFVYGSMSEGLVHFQKIKDFVLSSKPARIQGKAHRLKVGYPVVLEDGSDAIPGHLITLKTTDLLVQLLDQFHGFDSMDEARSLYYRKTVNVWLDDQTQESAEVYLLNSRKLPSNAKVIPQGDWVASLAQDPPLIDKLSERQKTYIARLGSSVGREIVPIDLPLYRELMNLEMIVDKGRRLALSKTGHEVYRYLN